MKKKFVPRDVSWLSFNARVLQEAADKTVSLKDRIRFLGIFSNNLDEFFRVRVAALKRMVEFANKKLNMHLETNPQAVLDEIQLTVLKQQSEFDRIWKGIYVEMQEQNVFLVDETQLEDDQKEYVKRYFVVRNKYSKGAEEVKDKTSGIGLTNVMRRLNLLYGSQHTLQVNKEEGWFITSLQLKLH